MFTGHNRSVRIEWVELRANQEEIRGGPLVREVTTSEHAVVGSEDALW